MSAPISHLERTACPICSTGIEQCNREGSQFYICSKCDLHYRRSPLEGDPTDTWERDYYSQERIVELHLKRRSGFLRIAQLIADNTSDRGRLLDIGCGVGVFLEVAKTKGWSVTGIEPSATAAEIARKNTGGCVHHADFLTVEDLGRFQVVTIFDVMRTVSEPLAIMKKAHAILEEGGLFVVRESNALYGGKTRMRAGAEQKVVYEYMQEWTQRAIGRALESVGFTQFQVLSSPIFVEGNSGILRGLTKGAAALVAELVFRTSGKVVAPNMVVLARK